jgi:AbrB family looped-hinge helix DNA binding protein
MKRQAIQKQEEWLKVLGKGMVTIPKRWRDELGFGKGDILKAKKKVNKIVIEFRKKAAPYRIYSKAELTRFIKDDALV